MDSKFQALTETEGVSVHSGFPNPALDKNGRVMALDLNQLIIKHPSSTYLFKIAGHSWSDQGIYDGDIAVVDRSLIDRPHDLVVVWEDSGFNLIRRDRLVSGENVWGIVCAVVRNF